MEYQRELDVAIAAVQKAAGLCTKVQKTLVGVEAIEKKDRSPVTIADLGSQALICADIGSAFPETAIVGEEDAEMLRANEAVSSQVYDLVKEFHVEMSRDDMLSAIDAGACEADFTGRYWTVDPIDGTKGFLRGEQYAIALALVEDGEVVLGILGCPNYALGGATAGTLFYAVKGRGAFARDSATGESRKISVDGLSDPSKARFCESVEAAHASHDEHAMISAQLGITQEPYRIDSQAKYASVACGAASLYLRLPRSKEYREKIWDHAAGAIVVSEAGGRVSDFSGKPLDFSLGRKLVDNQGILATNGCLHDRTLEVIAEVV